MLRTFQPNFQPSAKESKELFTINHKMKKWRNQLQMIRVLRPKRNLHSSRMYLRDCGFWYTGLTKRYDSASSTNDLYSFLWQYMNLSEDQIIQACEVFGKKYPDGISQNDLGEEVINLKAIHIANFGMNLWVL
ncbi:hypothetical protein LOD99_3680 [Oopsacas minuta]|uniref:Uncharacterized protein n=1 Tax=Oopsacas minuta TaxID=111878 RepID=A0AAV7JXN0_9METZ|nr:hypothetical protein LOD99_3680 [Oopsacas minuta]